MEILKYVLFGWLTLSIISVIWFAWEAKHAIDIDDMDEDCEAI